MNKESKNNTLSVMIPAKNDNYYEDTIWRLETTVNFLANSLHKVGVIEETEIIIVDWKSKVPIQSVITLNERWKKKVLFLTVPYNFENNLVEGNLFNGSLVANIGIRRSVGKYIAVTCSDTLWDEKFIIGFLKEINNNSRVLKTLFFVGRDDIPARIVSKKLSGEELKSFIKSNRNNFTRKSDKLFLFGGAGALIMHRDIWHKCRGLDESLIHWGWNDTDLMLRVLLNGIFINTDSNMKVFHLDHTPAAGIAERHKTKQNPKKFKPFVANDENWGMGNYKFGDDTYISHSNNEIEMYTENTNYAYKIKYLFILIKGILRSLL